MIFKGHKIIVIGDTHDSPKIKQDRFVWIGKYIKELDFRIPNPKTFFLLSKDIEKYKKKITPK